VVAPSHGERGLPALLRALHGSRDDGNAGRAGEERLPADAGQDAAVLLFGRSVVSEHRRVGRAIKRAPVGSAMGRERIRWKESETLF
jgi:hypothetical protein